MSEVLIVEDDREVRELIGEALRKEGLWTVGARDGEDALRLLREEPNPFGVVMLHLASPCDSVHPLPGVVLLLILPDSYGDVPG